MTRLIYFSRDYTNHDLRFLSALASTDYEVYYLRLERRREQLEDRPLPVAVRQIKWAGGKQTVNFFDGPNLLLDLRRVIKEVKPDLIHAGPIQRSAFLVALSGFKPLISASWGYDLLHDADRNLFWRDATRYTLQRSAILIGDCDTVRNKAIEFGMPDNKIVTFPWGIELDSFIPGGFPFQGSDQYTLLSTRNWEPIYGVEILAKAFVKSAQKNDELRLIMLGNGSLANQLRQTFTRGGVMDRVIFPGQVTHTDLPKYFQMADIYVSASRTDGSSISLIEAFASGRPAIVSDIPGNREWVEPGVNGWWFIDGDEDDLAEAILSAADQRQNFPEMGRAARQTAEERADWGKNFSKLLAAYEVALEHA
ncbi:MAG: glycosyltransferase family 4 protein [Chloroflexota bacterium]|nr:MAG: glycosyltransferase family 4 protein [Chloroflexota bacterium]